MHNVFDTLHEERLIHLEIQKYRERSINFCAYFLLRFFGKELPLELKRKEGYIMRGTMN